jgi:hypothetical protein
VFALFSARPLGKSNGIILLPALAVLRGKVVFLQALNPVGYLPFEVLKNHQPG